MLKMNLVLHFGGRVWANCHNGTRRAAENFLGHGTDEQFAQAGAAMGAENEQIKSSGFQ